MEGSTDQTAKAVSDLSMDSFSSSSSAEPVATGETRSKNALRRELKNKQREEERKRKEEEKAKQEVLLFPAMKPQDGATPKALAVEKS